MSGTQFKEAPKKSVIKVNNILMQDLKQIKINETDFMMNKILTFKIRTGSIMYINGLTSCLEFSTYLIAFNRLILSIHLDVLVYQ